MENPARMRWTDTFNDYIWTEAKCTSLSIVDPDERH